MKYAVLGPRRGVLRITEKEPQHVGEQSTVEQISDELASVVLAGKDASPRVFYFLEDGKLISQEQKRQERIASKVKPAA